MRFWNTSPISPGGTAFQLSRCTSGFRRGESRQKEQDPRTGNRTFLSIVNVGSINKSHMARSTQLVSQHLENISSDALEKDDQYGVKH